MSIALGLGHLGWFTVLAADAQWPVEFRLAPFALGLALIVVLLDPGLKASFRIRWRDLLVGLAAGLISALATHLCADLVFAWLPEVQTSVRALYGQASLQEGAAPGLIVCLLVVVVSEEVIWRGAVLQAFKRVCGRRPAVVLSSVVYAAATLGLGSAMLALAALTMGCLWTVLAEKTGRVVAPLVAHLTWDLLIFVVVPL